MSAGAAQVYVYYRVRSADVPCLSAAVRALHAEWQQVHPGLACALSRRSDDCGEAVTLMETYSHADGVPEAWQGDFERRAAERLRAWIVGQRHLERFVPCA